MADVLAGLQVQLDQCDVGSLEGSLARSIHEPYDRVETLVRGRDRTPLIAAMRAFVMSKFGETLNCERNAMNAHELVLWTMAYQVAEETPHSGQVSLDSSLVLAVQEELNQLRTERDRLTASVTEVRSLVAPHEKFVDPNPGRTLEMVKLVLDSAYPLPRSVASDETSDER